MKKNRVLIVFGCINYFIVMVLILSSYLMPFLEEIRGFEMPKLEALMWSSLIVIPLTLLCLGIFFGMLQPLWDWLHGKKIYWD